MVVDVGILHAVFLFLGHEILLIVPLVELSTIYLEPGMYVYA
jgi:hypothetical protein